MEKRSPDDIENPDAAVTAAPDFELHELTISSLG